MCWFSGMASSPTRRVSCRSRSRSLVCKRPVVLLGLSETNTIGYDARWGIETNFAHLKTTMGLDVLVVLQICTILPCVPCCRRLQKESVMVLIAVLCPHCHS